MRLFLVLVLALLAGCSRSYYRQSADRETYGAISERLDNPQWELPRIGIEPAPESRLFDPYDPDCPPMPPDDPAAHRYMHLADGRKGYRKWHKDGDAPWIESPLWKDFLTVGPEATLELTPERAIELGLLHSREYQSALEDVYLAALTLTLERFQFDLQWFGRNDTTFQHFGRGANESNTLTTTTNLGFNKAFTGGAQLLTEFANTWVWEFAGPNRGVTTSNIIVNLVQPLLRGGGRDVRMESLTQSERTVLYAVRDFARFRKEYSVEVAVRGYLALLLQLQNIRNQEANLASLNHSYRVHDAYFQAGSISLVDREQVFQQLQAGRLSLLQLQNRFDTALDDYKITLGLPPNTEVKLDDSLLTQFQLNDPALTKLENELEDFAGGYRKLQQAPPLKELQQGFREATAYHGRVVGLVSMVEEEIERWTKQVEQSEADRERMERLRRTQPLSPKEQLKGIRGDLEKLAKAIAAAMSALTQETRQEGLTTLRRLTAQLLATAERLSNLQTQVRVFLIRLRPVPYQVEEATDYALGYRLDLMNQRARVTDAWRQIGVSANALEADLDVTFNANIATPPGGNNPLDFRVVASTYRAGLQFDSPLNRQAERNIYRASLVNYQRARRAYMALDDRIQRTIRLDVRNLETERLNFDIAQLSLISAVRQHQAARDRMVLAEKIDPVTTLNILNALNAVLAARNTLIGSWVNYETGRIQLLLDMELLQLDAQGYLNDEHRHAAKLGPPSPVPTGK
jgi:outer membrane protein TolC